MLKSTHRRSVQRNRTGQDWPRRSVLWLNSGSERDHLSDMDHRNLYMVASGGCRCIGVRGGSKEGGCDRGRALSIGLSDALSATWFVSRISHYRLYITVGDNTL
jgi:hypothetical protein